VRYDLFVLAEGVTGDARGALALVGVNQRAISVGSLPFSIRPKVVIGFTDEASSVTGHDFTDVSGGELSIKVTAPDGNLRFAADQPFQVPIVQKQREDLPYFGYVIADVPISGTLFGVYTAEVSYRPTSGEAECRTFPVYIVPSQESNP
jgi:hypothetical protein